MKIYFLLYHEFSERKMLLFAMKFARPICQNQSFHHSRPMLAVRFFTHTVLKSREESAHLERRTRLKSGIPKKGPTWWESSRKQIGEEWQKALGFAVFLGFSLLFVKAVRRILNAELLVITKTCINSGLVRV